MKAGPKSAVDTSKLPFGSRKTGAARFEAFCTQYVRVPKGAGARRVLRLRPWQVDLVGSVYDPEVQPRTAGWMMPRGQGKSTLVAALGLYELMTGGEGASVVVVAVDERQAGIIFGIARRMVELNDELANRVQVFKDQLYVPDRDARFAALPASPASLEGLDFTLALVDEIGVVRRDVWEVVSLAQGKREKSTIIGIGTPGPDPYNSVLGDLRDYSRAYPDDPTFVWREFSAAGFTDHPVNCEHCWELANPALDDFLYRDALTALLPPKTREATFRRARLCQLVTTQEGSFLPEGRWDTLADTEEIPDGAQVVIALDGSFNGDATALLVATVSYQPHMDVVGLWTPPDGDSDYRVPVHEVEDAVIAAAKRWTVVEVIADPFRWTRSLQALERAGLPVYEFPWSNARVTPATTDFYQACINADLSHSGDPDLSRHVSNAVVAEDARGVRLDKGKRGSTRRIDLAACAVMAHSRAVWRASRKPKRKRAVSFA